MMTVNSCSSFRGRPILVVGIADIAGTKSYILVYLNKHATAEFDFEEVFACYPVTSGSAVGKLP